MTQEEQKHDITHVHKTQPSSLKDVFKTVGYISYYLSVIFFTAFSVLFLSLKFIILPNLNDYRDDISQFIYDKSKVKIKIGHINAHWDGLNPFLQFESIKLYNKNDEIALNLSIQSSLEWMHILGGNVLFDQINLKNTHLLIERDEKGQLHIAGIPLTSEKSDSSMGDWLLTQPIIYIQNSTIIWRDKQNKKPDLALSNVQFLMKNSVYQNKHDFGITANAPHEFGGTFDIRGNLNGSKLDLIHLWESNYYVGLKVRELSALHKYFDLPIELKQGGGILNVWVNTELGHIKDASARFNLFDFDAKLDETSPALQLQYVKGNMELKRFGASKYLFEAKNITALTQQDFLLPKSNIKSTVQLDEKNKLKVNSFEVDVPELDLNNLLHTAKSFPMNDQTSLILDKINLKGDVKNIKFAWQNNYPKKNHFKLNAELNNFSNKAYEKIPSIQHLSAKIEATQQDGNITLLNHENLPLIVEDKNQFETPLQLNQFKTSFDWKFDLHNNLDAKLNELMMSNAHLNATGTASYKASKANLANGDLDLNVNFSHVDAKSVHYYLPNVIGIYTKQWLKKAIQHGESKDTRISLKGNLKNFPFENDQKGIFEVNAKIQNGQLAFLEGWQPIEKINTEFILHNNRMDVKTSSGYLNQTKITNSHVFIENLQAKDIDLNVKGTVEGQTQDFLSYIVKNPLNKMIDGATQDFKGAGNGKLELALKIPFSFPSKTTVKGSYEFFNNQLSLGKNLPNLTRLSGKVDFSEQEVKGNQLNTVVYNSPTNASFLLKNNLLNINLNSNLDVSNFIQQQNFVELDSSTRDGLQKIIYGRSPWNAKVALNTKTNALNLNLYSQLQGTTINLPDGLGKSSASASKLIVEKKALNNQIDQIDISLENILNGQVLINSKTSSLEKSLITLGKSDSNSKSSLNSGLAIRSNLSKVNIDEWLKLVDEFSSKTKNSTKQDDLSATIPILFELKTDLLEIKQKPFHKVNLVTRLHQKDQISATLNSDEINGTLKFANNKVIGKFKNITLTPEILKPNHIQPHNKADLTFESIPNLDIDIEQFDVNGKKFGRVDLVTTTKSKELSLDKLLVTNGDAVIKGQGTWQPHQTKVHYTIDIYDAGKLLKRLNKSGLLKHTSAKIKGNLNWNGSPANFAFNHLNGGFTLEAQDGQFLKVDPGVAKLLSVLSLQSLPKRMTLDFKDVFSEGFAFEEMYGKFALEKGIININDFRMAGTLAGVGMKGKVNLNNETQNLQVKIVPNTVGDTISIASSVLGGPIGGLGSIFLQKMLKNPFNKITTIDLNVTGSLENPKIEKESASAN